MALLAKNDQKSAKNAKMGGKVNATGLVKKVHASIFWEYFRVFFSTTKAPVCIGLFCPAWVFKMARQTFPDTEHKGSPFFVRQLRSFISVKTVQRIRNSTAGGLKAGACNKIPLNYTLGGLADLSSHCVMMGPATPANERSAQQQWG